MTELEVLKIFGQGGFAVALLVVIYKIGLRAVAAIDRVGLKMESFGVTVNDHTKADLAAQSDVRRDMAAATHDIVGAIGELRGDVAVIDTRQQQMYRDWIDQLTPVSAERYHAERDDRAPAPVPRAPSAPVRVSTSPITRQQDAEQRTPTGEYSFRTIPGRRR